MIEDSDLACSSHRQHTPRRLRWGIALSVRSKLRVCCLLHHRCESRIYVNLKHFHELVLQTYGSKDEYAYSTASDVREIYWRFKASTKMSRFAN